jgi:hypothetical protein
MHNRGEIAMKKMSRDHAVTTFRRKARHLLLQSDKAALKHLFADLTAAACMEEGEYALEHMVGELEKALAEPHRRIRRDLFPRL